MPKALDITGQKFGHLTALEKAASRSGKTYWLCECDCGNKKEIQTSHLISGAITSCGCSRTLKKSNNKVVDFRRRVKYSLVEAFGHKCCLCGIVDDQVIYDFHHLDPAAKDFQISSSAHTRSQQAYLDEAKKCVLLCANCHRKVEKGLVSLDDKVLPELNEQIYWDTLKSFFNP